jgi:CPA2 family monovalent cation:H+ antiporter-2
LAVSWFDRVAPRKWVDSLAHYTQWVNQLRGDGSGNFAGRLMRRWAWQIALNLALISGIFIAATFMARNPPAWLPEIPGGLETSGVAWWVVAALLSLPCLVASYRKLQALGMLIGERVVLRRPSATAAQAILARAIPLIGVIDMGLLVLILSSGLLSSWKTLLILMAIIGCVAALLWSSLIRIYSKAQIALKDTLDEQPEPLHPPPHRLANLLKDADIAPVVIKENSPARGKLISELALRTRTGASIVAIERNGTTIVNPAADEEFLTNDQVLLLGRPADLEAARKEFEGLPT